MDNLKYLFLFFVIVMLQNCGLKNSTESSAPVRVEKTAPELSAVYSSFDEIEYMFKHQNDTTYVINFWATWCSPCVEELPYFEYMNKTYKDEKVKVILISLDSKKKIDSKLKPFIQREKLMSHCVVLTDIGYDSWIDKVNPDWDGAIPVTIIYKKDKSEFIQGEFENYEELNSIVKSYLKS